jgi:hypothetical protein
MFEHRQNDGTDAHVKELSGRFPESSSFIQSVSLENDIKLTKVFPVFLAVCIVLWIALLVIRGNYSLTAIIELLCFSFIGCFSVLGLVLYPFIDSGPLPKWTIILISSVMAAVQIGYGQLMEIGTFVDMVVYMIGFITDVSKDLVMVLVSIVVLTFVTLFATVGVLAVISAYLRVYLPRVFLSIDYDTRTKRKSASEGFFMIPDIVDVKDIEVEPDIDFRHFDRHVARNLFLYMILMMLLLSSNLFLNPYFLDTMGTKDLMAIMLMLSIFAPALIIPWQIIGDLKVRVVSDAPRDYYLWTGARKRLFSTFLTVGAFSMMFFLAMYYGFSITDMLVNYLYFLVPLICLAVVYSLVYANSFNSAMKVAILLRFMAGKVKSAGKERAKGRL